MTYNTISNSAVSEAPSHVSEWQRFCRVFLGRKVVIFGLIIIALFVIIAILAPFIAPYPPNDPNLSSALESPSSNHWLGTDPMGRDTLTRIMYGSQTSLEIGLIVVAIACLAGMILGTIAGYYGGWTNNIIMRIIDALMSFPMILLAMVITALMGSGTRNVIIALSVAMMPAYARVMCAQVISIKENDYVTASRSIGANSLRIMIRHTIPNCFPPLIVLVTMMLGGVILAEAGLSFLGIGIKPPTPTWGSMINDGRQYLLTLPILSFAPGVALMLLVFAFNMVGDGLRDALDPRLRGTL
jgi:peptide/nickel transport system permease protein